MPRRADLPTADEFFTKVCVIKRRPTWSAMGTVELALHLGVHQQTLWNKAVRGQMPPAEDPRLYTRIPHLGSAERPERRGNAREIVESYFHPLRPSGFGRPVQDKALI